MIQAWFKSTRLFYWALGGLLLALLYLITWIDTRWEHVMLIAGNYLFMVAIIGTIPIVYFMYQSIQQDKRNKTLDYDPLLTLLVSITGAPFFLFACAYIFSIALNAWLPPQTEVFYKGRVAIKDTVKGRSTQYYFVLDSVDSYGFELRLEVSSLEYRAYDEGEIYQREMLRGGLGMDYRLRW